MVANSEKLLQSSKPLLLDAEPFDAENLSMIRSGYCLSLILLSLAMQMGCNQISSKLDGDWGITAADKLLRKLGESASSSLDLKQSDESEEPTEPRMVLKFSSSGSLQTITKMGRFDPPPKKGNWKMLAWDENKQLMSIQCTLEGQTTEHDVHFIETDLIELIPPNMAGTSKRIQFRRLK